jgi:hypothetical protein
MGASNTTPVVVQTYLPHGLAAGDTVVSWGVGAVVGGKCIYSTANGIRVVKAVVDATHFSITDQNGNDIAANGPWCDGHDDGLVAAAAGGKVTSYTLAPQPRAWFDGPTGTMTRKLSLGTNNGLVSLVVSNRVATATTSYPHGISVGDKVGVWGASTAGLNNSGKAYTVTAVTDTTFQFSTGAISDDTYSEKNNRCGPSGDQDCLRISQLAYTGNIWWDAMVNRFLNGWESGSGYKHKFDGGGTGLAGSVNNLPNSWAAAALKSLVDPSDTAMRNVATYCVNHIERAGGVSFTVNENEQNAGNYDLNDFASAVPGGASLCYLAARDYLSPAERQAFADKMYNDRDDPTASACNYTRPNVSREILAAGSAQGGSASTITLAAADTQTDGYYVNNVIQITAGGSVYNGLVTAYNAANKTATIAGNWGGGVPSNGTPYTIYATMKISSTASGATATVTGYNTHFTTDFAVGDAIIGGNGWSGTGTGIAETESYIAAINSDTSLTVTNSNLIQASTTTPTIVWIAKQWQTGDCGLKWTQSHWSAAPSLPSLYPHGGYFMGYLGIRGVPGQMPRTGDNRMYSYTAAWMALDLVLADDDPRAITHLAMDQQIWWDYEINYSWHYSTGLEHSGSYYSFVREKLAAPVGIQSIRNSVPSFPMPDFSNWALGDALMKMYDTYPDVRYSGGSANHIPWPARFGSETANNSADLNSGVGSAFQNTYALQFFPNAIQSQYYLHYLKTVVCCLYDFWGRLSSDSAGGGLLAIDPRIQQADHTLQPTQYLFQKTSATGYCTIIGIPCPPTHRSDAVISRTGWTNKTDTHVLFLADSFWGDHNIPEGGSVRVYKAGHLLNSDNAPPGAGTGGSLASDVFDTMPMFGGISTMNTGEFLNLLPATSFIARWASGNHGSWDTAYGDAGSRYAYAMADLSGSYMTAYNRVQRHVAHFKQPGTEEVLMQFDDIDLSNAPTQVEVHIHYPQNGETAGQLGGGETYSEGNTTCPGGCGTLDTTRLIVSLEDGGTTAQDPVRKYGVVSRFDSPRAIAVRDDGSSYPKGSGHTHRVSLCGGNSCGGTVSRFEAVTVHKIASDLTDTNFTTEPIPSDPNWVAMKTIDAAGTGGKVALFARNGLTPFLANIQSDHQGTGQYLIAGLQSGFVYRVFRNNDGTDVLRQAVANGDNTLYFEAPAGTYTIFPEGLSKLVLRAGLPGAAAGSAFRYSFPDLDTSAVLQWSVTGTLPHGLSLSPAGVLSGTPDQPGDYTFTVTAAETNAASLATSAPFTLHVAPPAVTLQIGGVTSSAAIITYGGKGLDARQSCTLAVSPRSDFSVTTEQITDAGGASHRTYVAGATNALQPSTTYYLRAGCGTWSSQPVSFTTAGAATGTASLALSIAPPHRLPVAFVKVQYGSTPSLGSSVTVPCTGGCAPSIPSAANSILYLQHLYLDAASRVLGRSSVRPVAVGH